MIPTKTSKIETVANAGVGTSKNTTCYRNWVANHFPQASGTLGSHACQALVEAGFQVTFLTRTQKPGAYASNIKVIEVDFTSVDSLTAALKDTDAVVFTVAGTAVERQTILIDAAIAASVERFIASVFGNVTTNPKLETNSMYTPMFKVRRYLEEKAAAGQLSWTVLASDAFLDLILNTPTLLDLQNHTAMLIDEGDDQTGATSLANVGKAIAAILKNVNATEDKFLLISQAILTQNQLIGFAKELQPECHLAHYSGTGRRTPAGRSGATWLW